MLSVLGIFPIMGFSENSRNSSKAFLQKSTNSLSDRQAENEIYNQLKKQYQITATNLDTKDFDADNHFLVRKNADQVFSDHEELSPWQLNKPIIIDFSNPILQGSITSLHFIPADNSVVQYADSGGLVELNLAADNPGLDWKYKQTLSISPQLFYRSESPSSNIHRQVVNFPLDATYHLYLRAYIKNKLHEFLLLTFKTPEIKVFNERPTKPIILSDDWQSTLTIKEQKNLEVSRNQHQKESATENLRFFSGEGVKIALQDDGIRQDSIANDRVSFKLKEIPDTLLGKPSQQGAVHGTLMANFLIDYAPGVELFDFNIFPYVQHINKRLAQNFKTHQLDNYNYAGLALKLGADLMSISLVSPKLQIRSKFWIPAIMEGLVISKSLGNNKNITHQINQANCSDPTHFLPYFSQYYDLDMRNAEGALVTLQAALKTPNGYLSMRSRAGDAAFYTLTVLETQRGATSQAAATFSGIFALIKEAAERYNRNYSNKQLVEILFETADDIGESGIDPIYGQGLVNIDKALEQIERGYAPGIDLYSNLSSDIEFDMLNNVYANGCKI
jgi:hypothetical protein